MHSCLDSHIVALWIHRSDVVCGSSSKDCSSMDSDGGLGLGSGGIVSGLLVVWIPGLWIRNY